MIKSSEIRSIEAEKVTISGSKRCNEEIEKPKNVQLEFNQSVIESLRKIVAGFNINRTKFIDYSSDPVSNFFDKLLRRSFDLKLVDESVESLWEMSFMTSLSSSFFTSSFFLILNSNIDLKEEILIEYFKFILPFWTDENFKVRALRQATKQAIKKLFPDFFEIILMSIDKQMDKRFGTDALLELKAVEALNGAKDVRNWLYMCTFTVKMFPESVYESKLRIGDFNGSDSTRKEVFIHFLPILRNLMIERREEFDDEQDSFDLFVLFQFGDLDAKVPMGIGGLLTIDQMFLRSKINLSTFKLELYDIKVDIVERMYDSMFLGKDWKNVIKLLFDNNAFSIFESFLKYNKNLEFKEPALHDILCFLFVKANYYHELNFIAAMVAYINISEAVWNLLIETFKGRAKKIFIINQFRSIDLALKQFDYNSAFDINKPTVSREFEIKIDKGTIDEIAQQRRWPLQLEVARIFLARVCGIPLEMTPVTDVFKEDFEWSEAAGFINFYTERIAELMGYDKSDIIKFKFI